MQQSLSSKTWQRILFTIPSLCFLWVSLFLLPISNLCLSFILPASVYLSISLPLSLSLYFSISFHALPLSLTLSVFHSLLLNLLFSITQFCLLEKCSLCEFTAISHSPLSLSLGLSLSLSGMAQQLLEANDDACSNLCFLWVFVFLLPISNHSLSLLHMLCLTLFLYPSVSLTLLLSSLLCLSISLHCTLVLYITFTLHSLLPSLSLSHLIHSLSLLPYVYPPLFFLSIFLTRMHYLTLHSLYVSLSLYFSLYHCRINNR